MVVVGSREALPPNLQPLESAWGHGEHGRMGALGAWGHEAHRSMVAWGAWGHGAWKGVGAWGHGLHGGMGHIGVPGHIGVHGVHGRLGAVVGREMSRCTTITTGELTGIQFITFTATVLVFALNSSRSL